MRINHNIAALNTYRQLNSASGAQAKSMEKLSSGLRINKAGDDAAGLAISEKMRGQVRGLEQASRNSQDGISMIQTAEGALNETHSILQRMRELATQSANDTNIGSDRAEIQKEMNQLTSEINRIGNTTEFNTQKVLKGASTSTFGGGAVGGQTGDAGAAGISIGLGTFSGDNVADVAVDTSGLTVTPGATTYGSTDTKVGNVAGFTGNLSGMTLSWADDATADGAVQGGEITVGGVAGWSVSSVSGTNGTDLVVSLTDGTQSFDYSMGTGSLSGTATNVGNITASTGASTYGGSISIGTGADATTFTVGSDGTATASTGTYAGLTVSAAGAAAAGSGTGSFDITGQTAASSVGSSFTATLQIGANEGQSFSMSITDMRAQSLGIAGTTATGSASGNATFTAATDADSNSNALTDVSTSGTAEYALDVTDNTKASAAITVIDDAIKQVSAERSKLGAYQNRLEHTINNLGTSAENLTAAESRVRDVDYALAA